MGNNSSLLKRPFKKKPVPDDGLSLSIAFSDLVTNAVHPVLVSSDENYWPSTYSNSSGTSPTSTAGYFSPSSVTARRLRSPAMTLTSHHHHHPHPHHANINNLDHGYYVPQYEKLGKDNSSFTLDLPSENSSITLMIISPCLY